MSKRCSTTVTTPYRIAGAALVVLWTLSAAILVSGLAVGVLASGVPSCGACHSRSDPPCASVAAHASVRCERCHVPRGTMGRASFAGHQLARMVIRADRLSGHAPEVEDRRCLGCHDDVITASIDARGLRVANRQCASGTRCARCHRAAGPADPAVPVIAATPASSHPAGYLSSHSAQAAEQPGRCAQCHRVAFCTGCHGIEMPHDARFTRSHADRVGALGEAVCLRCHMREDCDECHERHVHPGRVPAGGSS